MTMGKTCNCSIKKGVLGSIIKGIGALVAVQGLVMQFNHTGSWDASSMVGILGFYIVGFVIIGASKCMSGTCCGSCK